LIAALCSHTYANVGIVLYLSSFVKQNLL